ncbi:MAG: hypothetical protein ACRDUY_00710 [Nitriliruptorales bacterium]
MRTTPRFVNVRWLPLPWIGAMTLPPWGIFIRRGRDSPGLRRHEEVHWRQYVQRGFFGFYLGYLWAWIRCGFSYERHPWEVEARRLSGPPD